MCVGSVLVIHFNFFFLYEKEYGRPNFAPELTNTLSSVAQFNPFANKINKPMFKCFSSRNFRLADENPNLQPPNEKWPKMWSCGMFEILNQFIEQQIFNLYDILFNFRQDEIISSDMVSTYSYENTDDNVGKYSLVCCIFLATKKNSEDALWSSYHFILCLFNFAYPFIIFL